MRPIASIKISKDPVFRKVFCPELTLKTKIHWYTGTDIFFRSDMSKFSILSISRKYFNY
jgi:hypothetical protein